MRLGETLEQMRRDGDRWLARVDQDWMQGRSAFGGLQAAFVHRAMRAALPDPAPLRSLQMTFLAPVPVGPVQACAELLRSGRSASHVQGELQGEGQRLALAVGVFGAARTSRVALRPSRPEVVPEGERRMPYIEGVTPAFTRHFTARWRIGGMPYTGSDSVRTVVDLDLHDAGPCSMDHVLALADFIPPVALSLLDAPAPGSSLTWMLECFGDDLSTLPLNGWRVDSELVVAQDGYTSQSNRLWSPDGRLIALSRQSMVVFG